MSWKQQALELAKNGDISWRKIAQLLDVPKSSVSDYLRKAMATHQEDEQTQQKPFPRVLVLDIETAPTLAWVYSLWGDNLGINQIEEDFYIMSFAAKWLGEDEVFYFDQRFAKDKEDDRPLLEKLWKLLNDADLVLGQNSKKFDIKKINARMVMAGMRPPSHYKQLDTLEIAKRNFGFTSNKLEYMTDRLCKKYKKSKHGKFPGFELWKQCLNGNYEAWEELEHYNKLDVLSTEELFTILAPWDNKIPNFDLYTDDVTSMEDWVEDGYYFTSLGKFQKYRNVKTGEQKRGRTNLFSKEKVESLLTNLMP